MRKIIRFSSYLLLSAALLTCGIVLTLNQNPNSKGLGNVYSDEYSISYTVNKDGSANVREMFSVVNNSKDLEELYLPINYKKENSFSSQSDLISFDYSSFNIILSSPGNEYAFNLQEKGFEANYFTCACSWEYDYDLTIKGEELQTTKDSSMAYLYCGGGYPEKFSITITYVLKNFVTVFNDYAYLETSARAFTYPFSKFYFTIALPGSSDEVTSDDIKLVSSSEFSKYIEHPSKSGFIAKGEGVFNSTFATRVAFPSSLMNTVDAFDEPQSNYLNSEITNAIYKKIAYKNTINRTLWVDIGAAFLAIVALGLIVLSLFGKKKEYSPHLNSVSPAYFSFLGKNKNEYFKDVINYYIFETKSLIPYLNGNDLYVRLNKEIEPSDDVEKYVISLVKENILYSDLLNEMRKNMSQIMRCRRRGIKGSNNETVFLNFGYVDLYFFIPSMIYFAIAIAAIFFAKPIIYFGLFVIALLLLYLSHFDEIFVFTPIHPYGQLSKNEKRVKEISEMNHSDIPSYEEIEKLFIGCHLGNYNDLLYSTIAKNNKDDQLVKSSKTVNNQKIIKKLLS